VYFETPIYMKGYRGKLEPVQSDTSVVLELNICHIWKKGRVGTPSYLVRNKRNHTHYSHFPTLTWSKCFTSSMNGKITEDLCVREYN